MLWVKTMHRKKSLNPSPASINQILSRIFHSGLVKTFC